MLLIDRKMPKSCIDCVCDNDDYWCNLTGDELDYDIAWTGRMPNCPLKEEELKTGKWERHYSRPNVYADLCWHCSNCGYKTPDNWANKWKFCPHCGAMMQEGERQ